MLRCVSVCVNAGRNRSSAKSTAAAMKLPILGNSGQDCQPTCTAAGASSANTLWLRGPWMAPWGAPPVLGSIQRRIPCRVKTARPATIDTHSSLHHDPPTPNSHHDKIIRVPMMEGKQLFTSTKTRKRGRLRNRAWQKRTYNKNTWSIVRAPFTNPLWKGLTPFHHCTLRTKIRKNQRDIKHTT